ncbi:MAG: transposase, partial [Thiohalorhabdaceae bacterium]
NQPDQAAGITFLLDWIERAQASDVRMLERFAQTLIDHWGGLIAYFKHPITTGPLEGLNNKIKTLKRQAYGFRDMEFFKLRIKAVHEARYAFTG